MARDYEYITDQAKPFAVMEEWMGERFPRYYISRQDNNDRKWYFYASTGQEKCAALIICQWLNDNYERLLAFEEEYYLEDE